MNKCDSQYIYLQLSLFCCWFKIWVGSDDLSNHFKYSFIANIKKWNPQCYKKTFVYFTTVTISKTLYKSLKYNSLING